MSWPTILNFSESLKNIFKDFTFFSMISGLSFLNFPKNIFSRNFGLESWLCYRFQRLPNNPVFFWKYFSRHFGSWIVFLQFFQGFLCQDSQIFLKIFFHGLPAKNLGFFKIYCQGILRYILMNLGPWIVFLRYFFKDI